MKLLTNKNLTYEFECEAGKTYQLSGKIRCRDDENKYPAILTFDFGRPLQDKKEATATEPEASTTS